MVSSNLNINEENGIFSLSLNPKFYSLDVIYSTCYVFLEKAYIVLDGDLENKIIVNIKAKEGEDGFLIAQDFNNELLVYSDYKINFKKNKEIRDLILQRAIVTNDPSVLDENNNVVIEDSDDEIHEDLETLENVVIPWEDEDEKDN